MVGESALEIGQIAFDSPDSSYSTTNKYRVLAEYAIQKLIGKENCEIYTVTGLPVDFMNQSRLALIEMLQKRVKAGSKRYL